MQVKDAFFFFRLVIASNDCYRLGYLCSPDSEMANYTANKLIDRKTKTIFRQAFLESLDFGDETIIPKKLGSYPTKFPKIYQSTRDSS